MSNQRSRLFFTAMQYSLAKYLLWIVLELSFEYSARVNKHKGIYLKIALMIACKYEISQYNFLVWPPFRVGPDNCLSFRNGIGMESASFLFLGPIL